LSDGVPGRFDDASRRALYRILELRRDIREFRTGDVDDDVLMRILGAAELAPSVGYSQPWGFVVIRDLETRARIRASFLRCREGEAARYPPDLREKYLAYKLEGIEDAQLNLCVTADLRPRKEAILGTTVQPEAVRASVCCAVQNLWLAARAEGLGVGWVSIVEPAVLREELLLPLGVEPVAYLCVGHALEFRERPMLEETGWRPRRPLSEATHLERWQEPALPRSIDPGARRDPEAIPPFSIASERAALEHQLLLTKPPGSLGRLEQIAAWYAGAHGRFPPPRPDRALIAIFAADHGVVVEGVSAYPSSLTTAMVGNVMAGGAAISCMARRLAVEIALVDVGVAGDLSSVPVEPLVPLVRAKVRVGTANLRREAAMTREQALSAMAIGAEIAERAIRAGHELLAIGEIGIGNTTAAAALICALTGAPPASVIGVGTGIPEPVRARKIRVVEEALLLHARDPQDPLGTAAALGGLEILAMSGFLLAAARTRKPVVLDGFVTSSAALLARAFDRRVVDYCLASHLSAERGAAIAIEALGSRALLDLDLRLGEGTGAILALDLVRTAIDAQLSMATFSTAGIVGRSGTS
jgi:nicotinate-nucleotide--dimethylbenzimidazole phosphoribosyltransferase